MFYCVVIFFIRGIYGCKMDSDRYPVTVEYFEAEMLNLTVTERAYPDDVEVTKFTGSCHTPMKVLPDQFLDDTFKKYEHQKQIRVPMTAAMHECAYDATMRARSACLVRRLVRFEMKRQRAPPTARCEVAVALRWRDEVRAAFTAARRLVCDAELALCQQSIPEKVLNSEQMVVVELEMEYLQEIQINLRKEDFAQNASTFVCQAMSKGLHGNLTVVGRLVWVDSRAADTTVTDVLYRAGDTYRATCHAPHAHWISLTDAHTSLRNKTFTTKLTKKDDGTKLICVDINCGSFERHQTCFKKILKEVRFHLKAAVEYGVISGVVVATLVLACAATCLVRSRRRASRAIVTRRPRMPTPPPERPPRRQPYYSVPFERPIPGPRWD